MKRIKNYKVRTDLKTLFLHPLTTENQNKNRRIRPKYVICSWFIWAMDLGNWGKVE